MFVCVSHGCGPACVCGGGDVISVCWSPAAWCLRNEGVSSVLLGASNTDQLMENIGAIQVRPLNLLLCFSFFAVAAEHIKSFPFSKEWDGGHLIGFIFVPSSAKRQLFRSRVQLVLLGSSPLHALLLYCTTLIRSAQYHLPRGLDTSSRPLLSLLIRLALLMGFAYWWGFGCSLHIIPGPQWRASPPTVSSSLMLCLHSWLCLRLCTLNPLPLCTFDISASKCYSHISRGVCSFLLARPFYPKPRIRTQSHM